jgi:hypothetical protein
VSVPLIVLVGIVAICGLIGIGRLLVVLFTVPTRDDHDVFTGGRGYKP